MSVNVGDIIEWDKHGNVRVVAIAEGYVMLRRPRCSPFLYSLKALIAMLKDRPK